MASYKLNIARIQGCPSPAKLAAAMEEYGLPEGDEFGVLNCSATDTSIFGTIVRKTQQAVQKLDAASKELTSAPVEKAVAYPFGIKPATQTLELYAGSAAGIEQMGVFLGSCLSLATLVEPVEMDIPAAIDKLNKTTQKFQLRSLRVGDYAHNSYMAGPYAPKFLDAQHGMEFLEEYFQQVLSAGVKFASAHGRVTVTLTPAACFTFSCHEDDRAGVQSILRKIV